MDFDILIWILVAALPVISGLLEKRRSRQQSEAGDQHPDPDAVELSAAEVIERILSGEPAPSLPAPQPSRTEPVRPAHTNPVPVRRRSDTEFRNPFPEPHWEQSPAAKKRPAAVKAKPVLSTPLPVAEPPADTSSDLPFRLPHTDEWKRAVILTEVLGPPRSRQRLR